MGRILPELPISPQVSIAWPHSSTNVVSDSFQIPRFSLVEKCTHGGVPASATRASAAASATPIPARFGGGLPSPQV